jgi:hypothetical protein
MQREQLKTYRDKDLLFLYLLDIEPHLHLALVGTFPT